MTEDELFYLFCEEYGFREDCGYDKEVLQKNRKTIEGLGQYKLRILEHRVAELRGVIYSEIKATWPKWILRLMRIE